jgi:hypothetical protein
MMMRWIAFAGGAAVLGGGAWYFGQPEAPPAVAPPAAVVAPAPVEAAEVSKDVPPLKVVQVIDLARAYEPVPEPEPSAGTNAALLALSPVPDRMPYADAAVKPASFWTDGGPAGPEHLKVMPREVDPFNLLHFDEDPNLRVSQLLNESEDLRQALDEIRRFWMNNQASVLSYERLNGPGERNVFEGNVFSAWCMSCVKPWPAAGTVERLAVMPREVDPIGNGLLNFVPTRELVFVPMGVPYVIDKQPIPPNASIQNGLLNFTPTEALVERLKVMPREISAWPTHCGQPTVVEYERRSGAIGP